MLLVGCYTTCSQIQLTSDCIHLPLFERNLFTTKLDVILKITGLCVVLIGHSITVTIVTNLMVILGVEW